MDRTVTTVIDQEKCIGCGQCARVCPLDTISMVQGKGVVTGERSLNCGHCEAICPSGAVRVGALLNDALSFVSFAEDQRLLPPGQADPAQLVRLMRSRRSCRNYTDQPVDRGVLEDLVRVGTCAPSGSNAQLWTFTILPHRRAMLALAEGMFEFFGRLNRMAERAWLRGLLRALGRPELHDYYHEHLPTVKEGMADWTERGRDRLFHGAQAAILVGSLPGASTPAEDALLASGQICLTAHAMGLGTCMVGFAVEALNRDARLSRRLGLAEGEKVRAVIALGHPDEPYQRMAGRKAVAPRYFEG